MDSREKFYIENEAVSGSDMEDNAGIVNGLKNLYAVEEGKKEEIYLKIMNKNKKKSRYLKVAAVAAALVLALPMTNYGQELITIVKEMATPSNRVQVVQERINIDMDKTIPEELKGKVFNADGVVMSEFTEKDLYDAEGNLISAFAKDEESGEWAIILEQEDEFAHYDSIENTASKLTFNPLILEGDYTYNKADLCIDENGKSDYANYFYTDGSGNEIILFERISSPETAYSTGTDRNIEEVEIDGLKAIYIENHSLKFERDGLLVALQCEGASYEELVEIYNDLVLLK